ncbi:MAG: STAS domain-containing protein [Candidatus Paceibacterota bacterium]|jgi:hypothetical protein
MKRYTQSLRHRRYIRRRAKRSLAARLRFKHYRRQKNREELGLPDPALKLRHQFQHNAIPFTKVKAPEILSLIRSPEEVAKFIAQLKDCFDTKKPVFVALSHVREIDYDGITVLLSVVVRFKSKRIQFNGDYPHDMHVRKTLEESGFFRHLLKSKFDDQDTYDLTSKSSIHTHAMRKVDSKLGEKIIESASKVVWGEKRRCPGVQRTLIELMQNTNNHASLESEEEKHWWVSVRHNQSDKRVEFSFVDYGVGVFYSLKNKRYDSKFFGILDVLYNRVRHGNNADVLKLIFEGELHRSATGKTYRGKGLPGIYEAFQRNKISNFAMITNDVYYNSREKEFRILKNEFQGTFVYWELTTQNDSLPHEN